MSALTSQNGPEGAQRPQQSAPDPNKKQLAIDDTTKTDTSGAAPRPPQPRLPLDVLYLVGESLEGADLNNFSRGCSDLWTMLQHQRAQDEARWWSTLGWLANARGASYTFSLSRAISQNAPLATIACIVHAYSTVVDPYDLSCMLSYGMWPLTSGSDYHHHDTPLVLAALRRRRDIVALLLENGAKADIRDNSGGWYVIPSFSCHISFILVKFPTC